MTLYQVLFTLSYQTSYVFLGVEKDRHLGFSAMPSGRKDISIFKFTTLLIFGIWAIIIPVKFFFVSRYSETIYNLFLYANCQSTYCFSNNGTHFY